MPYPVYQRHQFVNKRNHAVIHVFTSVTEPTTGEASLAIWSIFADATDAEALALSTCDAEGTRASSVKDEADRIASLSTLMEEATLDAGPLATEEARDVTADARDETLCIGATTESREGEAEEYEDGDCLVSETTMDGTVDAEAITGSDAEGASVENVSKGEDKNDEVVGIALETEAVNAFDIVVIGFDSPLSSLTRSQILWTCGSTNCRLCSCKSSKRRKRSAWRCSSTGLAYGLAI